MLALLFMVCGAGFVSCGSDDDEEGGGGSTNLPTIDANEQIASIYDSDNDIIFNYKDGVMTGGQIVEGGSFTITSSGIVYEEGGSDELYRETYTIKKRNSFGAVTSADVKCVEVGYGEQYTGNGTMTASYDSDNHLTSMNFSVSDGDFSESIKFTFTWSGGNLLKAVYEYVEEEYGYVYKDEETYVYEYGSDAVSNSGVYIPGFLTDMEYLGVDVDFPPDLGLIIETPGFLSGYSAYKNLEYLAGIRNRITKQQIKEAIALVGLDPDSRKKGVA